jgi:hypothetical protein
MAQVANERGSFSEIQNLKINIFKMFWDTMGCQKRHKDLSEEA